MRRRLNRFFWAALAGLLLIAAVTGVLLWLEYRRADLAFPEQSVIEMRTEDGEAFQLSWPQLSQAEGYLVRIFRQEDTSESGRGELLRSMECVENECRIEQLSEERIQIEIVPLSRFRTLFGTGIRHGSVPLAVTAEVEVPGVDGLEYNMDSEEQLLTVGFVPQEQLTYTLYLLSGGEELEERRIDDGELKLFFGETGDYPVPEYDAPAQFAIRASRQGSGYVLTGPASEIIVVPREEILTRMMTLSWEHIGDNRYSFTWNETVGRKFLVQRLLGEGEWETVAEVGLDEERKYQTETLHSGTSYLYRVEAVEDDGQVCASDEADFFTELLTLNCVVWPVRELELYEPDSREDTGIRTEALRAYRVLDERDGMFLIEADGTEGLIDSSYCLINLPDYLGELCSYDIVNSYSALYMMHGFEIPEITNTVIEGYEGIWLSEGEYLVPYLYPCCEKLITAARAALADGYRLKIYDAYRPHEATEELYRTAEQILDEPLPPPEEGEAEWPEDWSEDDIRQLEELLMRTRESLLQQEGGETLSGEGAALPGTEVLTGEMEAPPDETMTLPEESMAAEEGLSVQGDVAAPPEENTVQDGIPVGQEATPGQPEGRTVGESGLVPVYRDLVTNGSYTLSNFLARVGSAHNMGIALDLTLETLDGEELQMQTRMHDLSWYSTIDRNNAQADLLNRYMTGAGFSILRSEWWHFQDNETRDALTLAHFQEGVSQEGLDD